MKHIFPLMIVMALTLFTACAVKLAVPTEVDVNRGRQKFDDLTLEQLHQGKQIYELRCQSCHKLVAPTKRTEGEWRHIVPEMVSKTNRKAGSTVIDEDDQDVLLEYLITMSNRK